MPTERQLSKFASFISFRLPRQDLRRIIAANATSNRLAAGQPTISEHVIKEEIVSESGTYTDWSYEDLFRHASATLTNSSQTFNRLQAVGKGLDVPGSTFQEEFDNVTGYVATFNDLYRLASSRIKDDTEDEEEEVEEVTPQDTTAILDFSNDSDIEHVSDLASDPDFTSWTSIQMLLHAAELRYEAWILRDDSGTGFFKGFKEKSKYSAHHSEGHEALAYEREAKEWHIEGERRMVLEYAGQRKAWDFGITTPGGIVQEPTLDFEGVTKRWDWQLMPVEGKPALGDMDVPTLANSWESDGLDPDHIGFKSKHF